MAYNIHWKVKFKSLHAGTVYTANIYKDGTLPSGYPLTLKGAAQPFVTQEDENDDMFIPVRTQSGYLRIVDDGYAENANGIQVSFNWKELLPETDVSRPVQLTDGSGNVVWQGYIQAQNFSGTLYGNPQEREYPIQCALSTLSRINVNTSQFNGEANFAAILDYALTEMPVISFSNFYIQGGYDAREWLKTKIDWMVFGELDKENGAFEGKYSIMEALNGMCQYWGWTMRTDGQTIYMNCVDDDVIIHFYVLTRLQLETLAGGTNAGYFTGDHYKTKDISNYFANDDNSETLLRGCNKSEVSSETGDIDENIVFGFPDTFMKTMFDTGFHDESLSGVTAITTDKSSFDTDLLLGHVSSLSDASFNIRRTRGEVPTYNPIIMVKNGYSPIISQVTFESKKIHNFCDGQFTIKGKINKVDSEGKHIHILLGVGITRGTAMWWHLNSSNVYGWYNYQEDFNITIGSNGDIELKINTADLSTPLYGYVFFQIRGSEDLGTGSNDRNFDWVDFKLSFERSPIGYKLDPERKQSNSYTAMNNAVVKERWSGDTIFASDNDCKFGPGVVFNEDRSYFIGWNYGGHGRATSITPKQIGYDTIDLSIATQPEQHLANRVAKFWSKSRQKIICNLISSEVGTVSPYYKLNIGGSSGYPYYPYAISHNWRDDIISLTSIEI